MTQKWLHLCSSERFSPPELLAAHDTQLQTWSDRDCANARAGGCRGGAAPPESLSQYYVQFQCKLQRRLRPIFGCPQDHTLLVCPVESVGVFLSTYCTTIQCPTNAELSSWVLTSVSAKNVRWQQSHSHVYY
jgi:hypothetical protein